MGLKHAAPSYFSPGQSPVAPQGRVEGQYAAADPQNLVNYQYPLPDQNAAVMPLQYAADFNNYIQNNPEFFNYAEDEMQMQSQDQQQMVSTLSKYRKYLLTSNRASTTTTQISLVKQLKRLHTILKS